MNHNIRFPVKMIERHGCFLFGCILPYENAEDPYCCVQHRDMAIQLESAKLPCVVVDGLSDIDEKICGCLIRRNFDGIAVGIPNLNDEIMFREHPLEYLTPMLLPGEERRYFVFGHSKPPEVLAYPKMTGGTFFWKQDKIYEIHIGNLQVNLNRATLQCTQTATQQDWFGCRGWALLKYSIDQGSLFCITYNAKKESIERILVFSETEIGVKRNRQIGNVEEQIQPTVEEMREMLQDLLLEIIETNNNASDSPIEKRQLITDYVDTTFTWLALNQDATSEALNGKVTQAQTTLVNLGADFQNYYNYPDSD